ncbi:hypothetical protein [Ponticaulis sp.]|uniref:hypothetical protein n=1 Tax=Ponticaulis sp. TaxID=2020902 RepID=UPI000C66E936|nr:hypothetical protein [Ponticaulis sp.]MAJ10461.1 hypothetical protein [Ponticaulis sp.]HBH89290.1 hypothetical protein [Hyphomonadaceae bacterium]HBJ91799.1 hypothetical protein [Hyphomonadaceae bacterium]|tara:strand:- start:7886 stop:8281 length:396 start_codon:yes stop_codon:yes gene_type:complete
MRGAKTNFLKLVMTVVLVAIAFRASVPSGWMFSADEADGGVRIEMCGGGYVTLTPAPDDGADVQHDSAPDLMPGDECPFALSSLAVITVNYALETDVMLRNAANTSHSARGPPILRVAGPKLPARGPPHII